MKLVIGVDVGGTKIEAILHDGKKVLKTVRVPTEAHKPYKIVLANIAKAIKQVQVKGVTRVGVAVPGYVDGGILHSGPNNRTMDGKPLAKDLTKLLKLPVTIENDAKCFALAEAKLGAGKGKQTVIGVVIGTGIGAGIVLDGAVYHGMNGAAGEVGQAPLNDHDFGYYACGPGIVRTYESFGGKKKLTPEQIMTYKTKLDLDEQIPSKDESAVMLAQNYTYDVLARLTATLVRAFNPDIIVFGGGVAKSMDFTRLKRKTGQYLTVPPITNVELKRFVISDSAGSIGAALIEK